MSTPSPDRSPPSSSSIVVVPSASVVLDWFTSTATSFGEMLKEAVQVEIEDDTKLKDDQYPTINAIDVPMNDTTTFSYVLTPTLIEFATALADHESTFLHFPKSNQPFQLTRQQEQHARQLLEVCAPIGQLRFRLVPKSMKEGEFWRVYFLLMRNVARKVKNDAESNTKENEQTAMHSSTANTTDSSVPSPAINSTTPSVVGPSSSALTSASLSPLPSPTRSTLDFDAIDRLCGIGNIQHGRRLSMSDTNLDDDDDDDIDGRIDDATDNVLSEIVRRHRLSGSFSAVLPSPIRPFPSSSSSAGASAAPLDDSLTGDLGISEAELDAALLQEEANGNREKETDSQIFDTNGADSLP